MFILPKLPYSMEALEPHISRETLEYHYIKHHNTYVNKLNQLLITNTQFANKNLDYIVLHSTGTIFNNAAQAWNHAFYWHCLTENKDMKPNSKVIKIIEKNFNSLEEFKKKFSDMAISNFGSGWTWVIQNDDDSLEIINTSNADTPLRLNKKIILTCDVWEHAYYIDYRHARAKYLEAFWQLINWDFFYSNLKK